MDRITKSLLDEFCKDHGLALFAEDKQFEHFGAYLVMSRFQSETFDTSDLVVGDGGDTGFDALGIVVNGALVTEPEAIAELAERNGFLDVTFVFVQSDRGPGFETTRFGQIGYGVADFFREPPTLRRNDFVSDAAKIMAEIFGRSGLFKRGNPDCRVFYITTGRWVGDHDLEARRQGVIKDLGQLGIFRHVDFVAIGAEAIHKLYQETKNAIVREFNFVSKTVLPDIPGVSEAYLGILPAREYLNLICDDQGQLVRSIFYDNVRDWQDYNPVNTGIKATIESTALRPLFALMNNGITVIAKTLRATGNKFLIEDYQIVNGCQTSHVLFDQQAHLDQNVMIPVRIISTQDEEVIGSIIKATNRQTEVKEEQLQALSDFQKTLERFFASFENGKKLYYERRSRQYNSVAGIEKTRIVTFGNLMRSYASVILEEPDRTARRYAALLGEIGKRIFANDHKPDPYYMAAFAQYRLEYLFRNQTLDAKYKPARYHILMASRMITNPVQPPRGNANEMRKYCEPILAILWDADKAEKLFRDAARVVDDVAQGSFDRDHIRTASFTEQLLAKFRKLAKPATRS